jgi:hypothetical protein
MDDQQPRVQARLRFPIPVLVIGLLSAPVWYWIAVQKGTDPKFAFWSMAVALVIMLIAVYFGWKVAVRRNGK